MTNSNKHHCLQDGPWSKRLRSARSRVKAGENPIGDLPRPPNKSRAFMIAESSTQKLAKLVDNYPQLHSRMEEMLEDVSTKLESELVSIVMTRRQENEESSAIYKLSNDEVKLCFGFLGGDQYRFIAGTSHRFKQVYDDVVGDKKRTSINSASMSVPSAKLFLAETSPLVWNHKKLLCKAAMSGKLEVLEWAQDCGHDVKSILNQGTFFTAARLGHLDTVQFMKDLGFKWDARALVVALQGRKGVYD